LSDAVERLTVALASALFSRPMLCFPEGFMKQVHVADITAASGFRLSQFVGMDQNSYEFAMEQYCKE
jgi:hypothetical protein